MIVSALVALIALQHALFLILEMFLWRRPIGLRVFRMNQHVADLSANLAANQGLYNGFLVAGLLWSLFTQDPDHAKDLKLFFLGCVSVAGIFGGLTVNRRIFIIQAVPAILALSLLCLY